MSKKTIRDNFRNLVFERDGHKCVTCDNTTGPFDAHHIYNRELMPGGGYVLENGITLCPWCHETAEMMWNTRNEIVFRPAYYESYTYQNLYTLIGSSYIKAFKACTVLLPQLEDYPQIYSSKYRELILDLKNCEQEPDWHGEGNVYFHTQMVINELYLMYLDGILDDSNYYKLCEVALLHDIAKPKTTILEDDKIKSPGHSKLGEKIARELLEDHKDFKEREDICALVRFHGLPFLFNKKPNPDMAIIEASLRCNLWELSIFSEADFRGRLTNQHDLDEALFNIELFRERAEQLGCLKTPYQFHNSESRLHYFKHGGEPTKQLHSNWDGPIFRMLVGLPGSGKNTYCSQYSNPNYEIIELDQIRKQLGIKPTDKNGQGLVLQEAKEVLKSCLRSGKFVVWNSTNITKQMRSSIIDIALQYKAKIEIIYFDVTLEEALKINKTRPDKDSMPGKVIEKLHAKLEFPSLNECHSLQIVTLRK